jgi:hypothetical protein
MSFLKMLSGKKEKSDCCRIEIKEIKMEEEENKSSCCTESDERNTCCS